MQTQQAQTLIQQQLENLSQALDAGQSEAFQAVLRTMARFHKYSFGNVMLILCQRPDARRVAGFHTWKSLNRYVKQGEKGIAILAPMLIKVQNRSEHMLAEEEMAVDKSEDGAIAKALRFRVVYVFDIAQTDGEELPALPSVQGDPGVYTERLKACLPLQGITLEYADSLGGADGISKSGAIVLRNGLQPAEEFSVLAHEMAHELMHQGENRRNTTRTIRELEAEAVAFVVAQAIGLDAGTSAADYIQLYRGDKALLNQSLEAISKTAGRLLLLLDV